MRSRDLSTESLAAPLSSSAPIFNQRKSSYNSVTSLEESSSTADSGFNSVAASSTLQSVSNSAFCSRSSSSNIQSSKNDSSRSPYVSSYISDSSNKRLPSSNLLTDQASESRLRPGKFSIMENNTTPQTYDLNNQSLLERKSIRMQSHFDVDWHPASRGRKRYQLRQADLNKVVKSDVKNNDNTKKDQSESLKSSSSPLTSGLKKGTDNKSLFEFFLAQAKERDMKARMEKLASSKLSKRKSRSSSFYLPRDSSCTVQGNLSTKSTTSKRSDSANTSPKPIMTSGIQRSRSNVDINEMVSKAEKRDRHARVEQARMEGLIPPWHCMERKDAINTRSHRPASNIIKEFENKLESDSAALTGRFRSSSSSPDHSAVGNRQAITPRSAGGSHHRKFSSFLNNSRVARSAKVYYVVKCHPDNNKLENYRSSLHRTHSARSSTWHGSEILSSERSTQIADPEMLDGDNKRIIQDKKFGYYVVGRNAPEESTSARTTESLQREKSNSLTNLHATPSSRFDSSKNIDSQDYALEIRSYDESSQNRLDSLSSVHFPPPPPDLFQKEEGELEQIQSQLLIAEPLPNVHEDKDRVRWEKEQIRKKERAEERAKMEAERRKERQRQRERREEVRKDIKKQTSQKYEDERLNILREKEIEDKKLKEIYDSLLLEEKQQRLRLEEIRRLRKEEEKQLNELLAKRETEENKLRYNKLHKKQKKSMTTPEIAVISSSIADDKPSTYTIALDSPSTVDCYHHSSYKRKDSIKREQRYKSYNCDPSQMTFKDRQRLFQGGAKSPIAKIKSRKLLEIEESLRNDF